MSVSVKIIIPMAALMLVGAGCASAPAAPGAPAASSVQKDFHVDVGGEPQDLTTTLSASAASSSASSSTAAEAVPWGKAKTLTGVSFAAPKGYWVYQLDALRTQYLVPGAPPAPGSPDPAVDAVSKSVASFADIQNDPSSFPSWDRFVLTMAQFGCTSGSTEADFVTCSDKAFNQTRATSTGDFPYWQFSLPASLKKTGASRGVKIFIAIRFGQGSDGGILLTLSDARGLSAARALMQSMHRP